MSLFLVISALIVFHHQAMTWGFACWMVGSILHFMLRRRAPKAGRARLLSSIFVMAAMFLAARLYSYIWLDVFLAMAFGLLLHELASAEVPFPAWLQPMAAYGKNSSFSLYVTHYPLAVLLCGLLARNGRWDAGAESIALVCLVTFCCGLMGWLFSRCTEQHTAYRSLADGRQAPAVVPQDWSHRGRRRGASLIRAS
jgi:peptidoglycan/LPS O-acetylase OafA/YrhL